MKLYTFKSIDIIGTKEFAEFPINQMETLLNLNIGKSIQVSRQKGRA